MSVRVGSTWTIRDRSGVDDEWAAVIVTGEHEGEPVIRPVSGAECIAVAAEALISNYEQVTSGDGKPDRLISDGGSALAAWGSA